MIRVFTEKEILERLREHKATGLEPEHCRKCGTLLDRLMRNGRLLWNCHRCDGEEYATAR